MYLLNFGVHNRFSNFWSNFLFFNNFRLISSLNLEKFREPSLVFNRFIILSSFLLLQSLSKKWSLFLRFLLSCILLATWSFSPLNYRLNKRKLGVQWLLGLLLLCLCFSRCISPSLVNYLHAWFIIFGELLLELLKSLLFQLPQRVTTSGVLLHIFIKFTIVFLLLILHFFKLIIIISSLC
jgi:hypothetical protein